MEEQNNVNVEEKKEEKVTYKKHGFVYWLVIVLGMGFIVFMSIRMGEKIAEEKIEKNGGSTKTTVTSNSNSNKPEEEKKEECPTVETIPASDLYVYHFDHGYAASLKVEDGALYARLSNSDSAYTTTIYDNDNNYNGQKFNKVLDNVRRIKSYSFDTDSTPTFLAILTDGTVKHVIPNVEKNTVDIIDYEPLKDYKVNDITYAWNVRGTTVDYKGPYYKWTLKLLDGTVKSIEQ